MYFFLLVVHWYYFISRSACKEGPHCAAHLFCVCINGHFFHLFGCFPVLSEADAWSRDSGKIRIEIQIRYDCNHKLLQSRKLNKNRITY